MKNSFTTSHLLVTPDKMREASQTYLASLWNVPTAYPHISWFGEEGETLKIATVRAIQEHLGFAQGAESTRYCIVLGIDAASIPAQNALLKLIEEAPTNTQLVLVAHQLEPILPTIQSRCILEFQTSQADEIGETYATLYEQLATASIATALHLAEGYSGRDEALTLAKALLAHIHTQINRDPTQKTLNDLKHVLALKKQLESNCNAQLVVEEAFIKLSSKGGVS